jgi:hypothetical protein
MSLELLLGAAAALLLLGCLVHPLIHPERV